MATTVATVNQTLVDSKVVEALRSILPVFSAISYRPTAEGKIKNDVVYVPIATDPTAQSKTAGTLVTSNGTLAGTSVTLSNHYAAGWDFTEGTVSADLFPAAWADKAAGAVYSLAKQVIDATLALLTASNYSDAEGTDKMTVAIADYGMSDLALMWKMAAAKIKQRQKTYLMGPDVAAAIFGESVITNAFAYSGNNVIATGNLPSVLGMPCIMYDAFPANSEGLASAVVGKAAMLAAVAPPQALSVAGEGAVAESRIITDPDSGLSVLYKSTAEAGGAVKGECSILYGVAKGQNAAVRHEIS